MADYIDREKLLKSIPSVKDDKTISLFGAVADMICIVNSVQKRTLCRRDMADGLNRFRVMAIHVVQSVRLSSYIFRMQDIFIRSIAHIAARRWMQNN